jgi:hypothetical protein
MASTDPSRSYRCSPSRVRAALEEVRRQGGTVKGSESEGTVSISTPLGPVEGRFTFDGELLSVVLTRRPALVPEGMVWGRLDALCGPPLGMA